MCEGCEWLWNSGILDATVGLCFELDSLEFGSDNHAIAWTLAKDNADVVKYHIHRALHEEMREEGSIMQLLMSLMGEML